MYTVKAIKKNTVLEYKDLNTGIVKGIGTRVTRNGFAVMNASGQVARSPLGQFEVYRHKVTAQMQADHLNKLALILEAIKQAH